MNEPIEKDLILKQNIKIRIVIWLVLAFFFFE